MLNKCLNQHLIHFIIVCRAYTQVLKQAISMKDKIVTKTWYKSVTARRFIIVFSHVLRKGTPEDTLKKIDNTMQLS